MTYYHVCLNCGCNLDPSEICNCKKEYQLENGEMKLNKRGGVVVGGYFAAAGGELSWSDDRSIRVG